MAHRLLWAEKACSRLERFEEGSSWPHPSSLCLTLERRISAITVMMQTGALHFTHLQDQHIFKTNTTPKLTPHGCMRVVTIVRLYAGYGRSDVFLAVAPSIECPEWGKVRSQTNS